MQKNVKLMVPATLLLAALALSGCSSLGEKTKPVEKPITPPVAAPAAPTKEVSVPQTVKVDSIDSRKEVAYKCGTEPLNVMYGMKGNQVVVAQVKYKNQLTPGLFRVLGAPSEQNAFWGENIAWIAQGATAATVDKVNGNMLTLRGVQNVNGQQTVVDQVVAKGCELDKVATAKLKAKK